MTLPILLTDTANFLDWKNSHNNIITYLESETRTFNGSMIFDRDVVYNNLTIGTVAITLAAGDIIEGSRHLINIIFSDIDNVTWGDEFVNIPNDIANGINYYLSFEYVRGKIWVDILGSTYGVESSNNLLDLSFAESYIIFSTMELVEDLNFDISFTESSEVIDIDLLQFLFAYYDYSTYKMNRQITGSGTPASTHTSTLYAKQSDGYYKSFTSNKPVFTLGRYVDEDNVYADNGSGTILNPHPYYKYNRASQNLIIYSEDLSSWDDNDSVLVTKDITSLKGIGNDAYTIEDESTTAKGYILSTPTFTSNTGVIKMWFKSEAGNACSRIRCYDSGVEKVDVIFSKETLAYENGIPAAVDEIIMVDDGNWTIIMVETSIDIDLIRLYPAVVVGDDPTGLITNSAVGSIEIPQVEFHPDKHIKDVDTVSPIFTSGSNISVDETINTWDGANWDNSYGGFIEILKGDQLGDIINIGGNSMLSISPDVPSNELFVNHDFSDGFNGWSNTNDTLTVSGGILTYDGDGAYTSFNNTILIPENENIRITIVTTSTTDGAIKINNSFITLVDSGQPAGTYITDFNDPDSGDMYITDYSGSFDISSISLVRTDDVGLVLSDGTNKIRKLISGGSHKIGFAIDTSNNKMKLCVDDSYEPESTYDGSFGTGTITTESTIYNFKQYINSDYTEQQNLIDTDMA